MAPASNIQQPPLSTTQQDTTLPGSYSFYSLVSDVAEVIVQIAVRVAFIAAHIFMAVSLPVAWHWFAIPIAAIGSTSLAAFFFPHPKLATSPSYSPPPPLLKETQANLPANYPADAPVGYSNSNLLNCCLNSMAHFLDSDPQFREWVRAPMGNVAEFIKFLDEYDPPESLKTEFQQFVASNVNSKVSILELFVQFMGHFTPKDSSNKTVDEIKIQQIKNTFRDLAHVYPAFQEFYLANNEAITNRQSLSNGDSQKLRKALSAISASIRRDFYEQLDVEEPATIILDLMPDKMKTLVEKTYHYFDSEDSSKKKTIESKIPHGCLFLEFDQANPTFKEMLKKFRYLENKHPDQNKLIDKNGKHYVLAHETTEFIEAPPVLHLEVKRFEHNGNNEIGRKLATPIDFQERISIRLKNGEKHSYRLASFVVHHGSNVGNGHYTSGEIRNENRFLENDRQVTWVQSPSDLQKWKENLSQAYLLCYLRDPLRA